MDPSDVEGYTGKASTLENALSMFEKNYLFSNYVQDRGHVLKTRWKYRGRIRN